MRSREPRTHHVRPFSTLRTLGALACTLPLGLTLVAGAATAEPLRSIERWGVFELHLKGPAEVKRIADMAYTFGVDIVPHTWGTGIALSAALHLIANLDMPASRLDSAEALMELDRTENPLRDELAQPIFTPDKGRLQVPDEPGLGVNVDEDALEKYLLK